jgi:hypothetical protein
VEKILRQTKDLFLVNTTAVIGARAKNDRR